MDAYLDALNPLKDQIFNANVQTMKEAGITYFTSERLPENIGDKKTLTLQQMLDMKLIIPFTDRNGNSCDVQKSYVSLEKQETEYLMKVNLKCGEEEDYILVHLGCYSYCTKDICEAKPQSTEKPSTKPVAKKDNIKPTNDPTPPPTSTPTYKQKFQCRYVGGEFWGKYSTVVDYNTYLQQCPEPTPTPVQPNVIICSVVGGIYYDNNGNPTTEANYNNVCNTIIVNPTPTPTLPVPTPTITPSPKYSCEYAEGKYWNKSGMQVSKSDYEKDCAEWQYQKTLTTVIHHDREYSSWSAWKEARLGDGQSLPKSHALLEVVDLGEKQYKIGTVSFHVEHMERQQTNMTVAHEVCKNYKYDIEGSTMYKVVRDWYYTGEVITGLPSSINIPAATYDTRWVYQGIAYDVCKNTCTDHPYVKYAKMKRDVEIINNYKSVKVTCTQVETQQVPVYITAPVSDSRTEDVYAKYHIYKYRTRKIVKEAYDETKTVIDEKWSYYNDKSLLNAGYKLTGNFRFNNK